MKHFKFLLSSLFVIFSLVVYGQSNEPLKIKKERNITFKDKSDLFSEEIRSTVSSTTTLTIQYSIYNEEMLLGIHDKSGIIGKYVYSILDKAEPYELSHCLSQPIIFMFANGKCMTKNCNLMAIFKFDEVQSTYDFDIRGFSFDKNSQGLEKELLSSDIKTIKIGTKSVSFNNSRTAPTMKKMLQMAGKSVPK